MALSVTITIVPLWFCVCLIREVVFKQESTYVEICSLVLIGVLVLKDSESFALIVSFIVRLILLHLI